MISSRPHTSAMTRDFLCEDFLHFTEEKAAAETGSRNSQFEVVGDVECWAQVCGIPEPKHWTLALHCIKLPCPSSYPRHPGEDGKRQEVIT